MRLSLAWSGNNVWKFVLLHPDVEIPSWWSNMDGGFLKSSIASYRYLIGSYMFFERCMLCRNHPLDWRWFENEPLPALYLEKEWGIRLLPFSPGLRFCIKSKWSPDASQTSAHLGVHSFHDKWHNGKPWRLGCHQGYSAVLWCHHHFV